MIISSNNYGEYLLSYVDGELSAAETVELLQFLQDHPELQEELKLLQATKLEPEAELVFGDKQPLYRHEKSREPVPLYRKWWLSAAAAVILALIGINFLHRPLQPKNNTESAIPHPKASDTPVSITVNKTKTSGRAPQQKSLAAETGEREKTPSYQGQPKITGTHSAIPGQVIIPANNKEAVTQQLAVNSPEVSKQQNNNATGTSLAATKELPDTGNAVSLPPIAGNGSSKTAEEINNQPNRPEQQQEETTRPLLAKVNGMAAEKAVRVLGEPAKLAEAKEKMNEKITDKIGDAQNFVAKKFQSIRKKGIRIGRLEIVMN